VEDLSEIEIRQMFEEKVEPTIHLMSDEWKSFMSVDQGFVAHDTVRHSQKDIVRGIVPVNSAEGFPQRVGRAVVGWFIISAQIMRTCTAMKSAFDSHSALFSTRPSEKLATDEAK
jgi:hypothetical protein